MRTTLDIDADILKSVKALAEAEHKTLGQVLSELVRKGLAHETAEPIATAGGRQRGREQRCRKGGG